MHNITVSLFTQQLVSDHKNLKQRFYHSPVLQTAVQYQVKYHLHSTMDFRNHGICSLAYTSIQLQFLLSNTAEIKLSTLLVCTCMFHTNNMKLFITDFPCSVSSPGHVLANCQGNGVLGQSESRTQRPCCKKLHVCLSSSQYTELVYQASPSLTFQNHFPGCLDRLTLCTTLLLVIQCQLCHTNLILQC